MTRPDLIFFIQNKDNWFWQRTSTGNIVLSPNPKPLEYSPAGWPETTILNKRNKKYWAIDRQAGLSYKYVEDGADILKYIFLTKGVEEKIYLSVCELKLDYVTDISYKYWYDMTLKIQIDLSTYQHVGAYVTANTVEEGLAKHLRSNENTKYPIDLNVPEAISLRQDGVILNMIQHYGVAGGFVFTQDVSPFQIALPLFTISNEGTAPYIEFQNENLETFRDDNSTFKYALNSNNWFANMDAQAPVPIVLNFSKKLRIKLTTERTVRQFQLYLWTKPIDATVATTPPLVRTLVWNSGLMVQDEIKEFDFSTIGPFTINAGDKLFFMLDRNPAASPSELSDYEILEDSALDVTFESRFQETFCQCLRPQYIWNQLVPLATGGEFNADDCPYFTTHFNKVFTSGDGVRSIENAKMYMSITQFLSFWDTYDAVGIKETTGNKVIFDRKKTLTNTSSVTDIGEVSNPKIGFDKELPFNELHIGYEDEKNESGLVNGKNEFNTTSIWSIGTSMTPKILERISQISASCYKAEGLRIDNILKSTTDNRSDNALFVFHIEDEGIDNIYNYERGLNSSLTGVLNPESVYNVALSPARCLQNSGDYIRSLLYLADNKTLKFISSDRNQEMVYNDGTIVLIEKADVPVGSLSAKFFLPILIYIDTPGIQDPFDVIGFYINGHPYTGISIENSVNIKTFTPQTYILWSTPDNNLLPLIKYYGE